MIELSLIFLTSLAALITAIASLKSVKEIKRQRESSYMPEPMFTKTYFYTYWGNPKKGIPIFWSTKDINEPPFNLDSYPSSRTHYEVQFECFNVGMGVAKNVEIVWDFDTKKFVKILEKLDEGQLFRYTINGDSFIQIFSKKHDYLTMIKLEQTTPIEFKFILPFGVSDLTSLVRVPIAYTELFSIFLYLFIHESSNISSINLDDIPPLKGTISYNDIESELYRVAFLAFFSFTTLSGKIHGKEWSKAAKIEVDFTETRNNEH